MRQGQARQGGGGKSKRRVISKDSLFNHHHPNFYYFFPRAIAAFTGIINMKQYYAQRSPFFSPFCFFHFKQKLKTVQSVSPDAVPPDAVPPDAVPPDK